MHNTLYLGFDGGATKTTGIAMDGVRNILGEVTGGP
jgi:N-acetylglucosamine kinase-like BadF-type ATPase